MKTLRDLSEIQEDVLSEIHLQMALDAFNANDYTKGVEYLRSSSQTGRNAAALYNLGLCYQEGLGVEQDRTKVTENQEKNSWNSIENCRPVNAIVKPRYWAMLMPN